MHGTADPRAVRRVAGGMTAGSLFEVPVKARRSRLRLALVLAADLLPAVRTLDWLGHPHERDLADRHAVVDGYRQVRDVGQLERQVALPGGVDEAGRGVDQQAEPAEGALALEARDDVVGQRDRLEGLAQDELARMEYEGLLVRDLDQLREVVHRLADVDVRIPRVVEHA